MAKQMTARRELAVRCPACGAPPANQCRYLIGGGARHQVHSVRFIESRRQRIEDALLKARDDLGEDLEKRVS